jgi:asparagine synthetase B (glutamine-hydrolysing)
VKEILNYNFDPAHIHDGDFAAVYESRRRDSCFAFVYRTDGGDTVALRDHLGAVPLYYRATPEGISFSVSLGDLVKAGDEFDDRGLDAFLSFGTAKLAPLIRGVAAVPPGAVIRFAPHSQTPETVHQYRVPAEADFASCPMADLVDELDRLLGQAITRTIAADPVGLYMSGGIDSGLIARHLKRAGVTVNAYTSSPWGPRTEGIRLAKLNAAITGVDNHTILPLDPGKIAEYAGQAPRLYGGPKANSTHLAAVSLWRESSIGAEQQVYFGMNADTVACSIGRQSHVYFLHRLPSAVKRRLHPTLRFRDPLADYLSFSTDGRLIECEWFARRYGDLGPLRLLTLAGMYIDELGEYLALPAVRRGVPASDPYHDLDLVEFWLRVPLRHRVRVARSRKRPIRLDKLVQRKLAERHFPSEVVDQKRAFTVPFARDRAARRFEESLPRHFAGKELRNFEERFAASVLTRFATEHELAGLAARADPPR